MPVKHHFRNIRRVIELELLKAKFDIYIAVAWFTDKLLFDTICRIAKKGVDVRIMLIKDKINKSASFDHRDIEKYGGKFFFRDHHHKFCVIDRKIVISGSSNWTNKAFQRYIGENISVNDDKLAAENFARIFIELAERPVNIQDCDFQDYYRLEFIASFKRTIEWFKEEGFDFCIPDGVTFETLWNDYSHKPAFISMTNPEQKVFVTITPELRNVLNKERKNLPYLPVFAILDGEGNKWKGALIIGLESNNGQRFDPTWTL